MRLSNYPDTNNDSARGTMTHLISSNVGNSWGAAWRFGGVGNYFKSSANSIRPWQGIRSHSNNSTPNRGISESNSNVGEGRNK